MKGVAATIDPKTKLVPVTVELAKGSALPGENFRAMVFAGTFEGWLIQRDSLGYDKNGAFVFQVDDQHAKRIKVNVIGSAGETSVVTGDIDPQRKLVLAGSYQVGDGDEVRTQEPVAALAAEKDQGAGAGEQIERRCVNHDRGRILSRPYPATA